MVDKAGFTDYTYKREPTPPSNVLSVLEYTKGISMDRCVA